MDRNQNNMKFYFLNLLFLGFIVICIASFAQNNTIVEKTKDCWALNFKQFPGFEAYTRQSFLSCIIENENLDIMNL